MNIFKWLIDHNNAGSIELHLIFNGIDYDTNFHYEEKADILTACSTSKPNESFGSDGQTITQHMTQKNISISFRFI